MTKQLLGYEVFGYWFFFAEDESASQIIQTMSVGASIITVIWLRYR